MESVDEKTIYRAFGARVAARRAEIGLTQSQVAEAIDASRATVANVERGEHRLPLHQVYRLSLALGLQDVSALLPPLPHDDPGGFSIDIAEPEGGLNDAARRQIARLYGEIGVEVP